MKKHPIALLMILMATAGVGSAVAEQAQTVIAPTAKPVDRLTWKDRKGQFFWKTRHELQLSRIAAGGGKFDFVLLGDSITHNWEAKAWNSYFGGVRPLGLAVGMERFAGYKWLNLGIGGDGTEQVIWRCLHGQLDGYETRLVSILIGTNNRRDSAEDVALGIQRVIGVVQEKQPKAKILLNAILPRFPREDDPGDMNAKNRKTNEIIKGYCDGRNVIWIDWGAKLLKADGTADPDLYYDREHPSGPGYEIWADAILPHVREAAYPKFGGLETRFTFNEKTGALMSVAAADGRGVADAFMNRYTLMAKSGDVEATEDEDVVEQRTGGKDWTVYRCTNPKMPGVAVVKRYAAYHGGVRRTLTLENSGKEKKYLTPFTECRFVPSFQTNLWHLGAGYIGPYKPFPTVGQARQVKEYKQSSKGLVLIHPDGKRGNFTHYRVKLDDQVVFPWWYSTIGHYREYHDRLWYLPDGYRMGLGTFGLETGKAVSVTDQFTFFDGDLFTFFDDVFAKDEDVARELASIPPPPKWTDDLLACMGGDYDDCVRWMTEMTDEGVVLAKYFGAYGWGDYPVDRNIAANQGGVITPQELRTYMQDLQAISPSRVKSCIYQIVISTSFFSKVFKDHPEWFRVHDRDGKRDSLFPGLNMNWQTMFNNADCRRWLVDMLCRSSDYLGTDTVYLDETQMTNTIDWERDQITLDSDTVKFWKELKERFREKGKMFYANGSGCPYADLNYMESPHELAPNRWRDWAGVGWGIGMMNRMRPGQRTSPLTWTKNLDYINRILALGWVPNPYLMCCINYLTTIRAVYQSGNLLPVNAKYAPDWKTDDQVEVESHTMKRADAKDVLLSFINRAEAQDIPVAVMLGSLGFGEGERINVWKLHVDTERYTANYRENLSDKELKANWREQGTVRNARITDPELLYSGKADGVFKDVIAKLGRDKIEQYLFTASPAAFYAVDDLPLNYFYTAQRKARIEGNRVKLQKKSDILLIDKARDFTAVTANGQPVATRRVRVGPLAGTLAALGPGEWTLEWKEIPRKPADETVELPFEGPKQITKVKPPVPFYDPERFEVKETNVVKDGVKIVKAAVYDKRLLHTVRLQTNLASTVTAADPEKLTLVAGPSRREYTVRDFETFSGFELEGARSVRLKFSHTFGDVISIYLGHITFNNPGKTNEFFTGFIVDYRVGGKYVKRVSMSTGLFHPAYTLTCPKWGTGRAPDEKIDLGEWINGPKERVFSMDLAKHAPEGWDGTAFLSLGTVRIMSGRSLKLEILSFNDANASDFCRVRPEPAEPLAWAPLKNGFFEHGGYGTLTMDFKWRTR